MSPQLRAELQSALDQAIVGQNMGPGLSGRLATAARTVLLRRGMARSQVLVQAQPGGFAVEIRLPPGPKRVQRVVFNVESGF